MDWFGMIVAGHECPECGFDASEVPRGALASVIMGEARRWEDLLADLATDDGALRRHPEPGTWSPLEYAAHVAGVFAVFAERVARMRAEVDPVLGWWDHEAAVTAERYNERSPSDVRVAIADGAVQLALSLPRPDDDDSWVRTGTRREQERFTIDALARFAVHESAHHRFDARLGWSTP